MRPKVAVCFGGVSVEHEVSTISGIQALHAIDQSKYDPFPVYVTKTGRWFVGDGFVGDELGDIKNYSNIDSLLSRCEEVAPRPVRGDTKLYPLKRKLLSFVEGALPVDIYFPVFHGSFGEDGAVQGLFQLMNVPYVGCDVTGAATSMDKIVMKSIFRGVGLPVIESCWFTRFEFEEDERAILQRVEESCGFPCIVKPATLGSSVGIQIVMSPEEFKSKALEATTYCPKILVERYIRDMIELNCSVLGNESRQRASVLEQPVSSGALLSFQDKYERGAGSSKGSDSKTGVSGSKSGGGAMASMDRIIPADTTPERAQQIQTLAKKAFRALGCSGVSRIDFIVETSSDTVYVNELNSIPGSLSFYLWEKSDLSFQNLTSELLGLALERFRERQAVTYSYETNLFAMHSHVRGSKAGGSKSSG